MTTATDTSTPTSRSARHRFVVHALPADAAARLRALGGPRTVADEYPGFPCRACLRDAAVGDELILTSYDPFRGPSPYRSASPIFLHAHDCSATDAGSRVGPGAGPGAIRYVDVVPDQLARRQLSVRAFDQDEMMIDAAVIDGTGLDALLVRFLDDPEVDRVHVHNATRGCWAATVDRG